MLARVLVKLHYKFSLHKVFTGVRAFVKRAPIFETEYTFYSYELWLNFYYVQYYGMVWFYLVYWMVKSAPSKWWKGALAVISLCTCTAIKLTTKSDSIPRRQKQKANKSKNFQFSIFFVLKLNSLLNAKRQFFFLTSAEEKTNYQFSLCVIFPMSNRSF